MRFTRFSSYRPIRDRLCLIMVCLLLASVVPPVGAQVKRETTAVRFTKFTDIAADQFKNIKQFPWSGVPTGKQTWAGVNIDICGAMTLWGKANADRGLVYQKSIEGIPINAKFQSLYLCHAVFFESKPEEPIFHVVFNTKDRSQASKPLLNLKDGRDWFLSNMNENPEPTGKNSVLAWAGKGPAGNRQVTIRFTMTSIDNPFPDEEIVSIDLVSELNASAGCIVGLSIGQSGALQPSEFEMDSQTMAFRAINETLKKPQSGTDKLKSSIRSLLGKDHPWIIGRKLDAVAQIIEKHPGLELVGQINKEDLPAKIRDLEREQPKCEIWQYKLKCKEFVKDTIRPLIDTVTAEGTFDANVEALAEQEPSIDLFQDIVPWIEETIFVLQTPSNVVVDQAKFTIVLPLISEKPIEPILKELSGAKLRLVGNYLIYESHP